MRLCPLCASSDAVKLLDLDYALFDDLHLSGEMQLVACSKCQALYNATELSRKDFDEYYIKNDHYLAANAAGSGGYSLKDEQRYARIYGLVEEFLASSRLSVLDFGCGKGGMLRWLQKNTDAKIIGVEASVTCREFVRNEYAIPVFSSLDELSGKADVVVLSHVVEHLFSPMDFFMELERVSHDETIFYVEVPRAEAYLSEKMNWHELYFEHINHFGEAGLSNLMQAAGFQILKRGIVNFYQNDLQTTECQYVLVRKGKTHAPMAKETVCSFGNVVPAHPVISEVLESGKMVSVWGISQYTQLVLGTYPQLFEKIRFLFDGSSAKIGRTIKGFEIHFARNIPGMVTDEVLLLPNSPYLADMMAFLKKEHFVGQVIQF